MKLISLIILITGSLAFAEGHDGACKADAEKFCKGVAPGQGAIVKCLKEHQAELSAECKANATEAKEVVKEKIQEAKEACADDAKKFCGGEKPGRGAILKCLKSNESSISQACKDSLPGNGKWRKAMKH